MTSFFHEVQRRAGGDVKELARAVDAALCLLAPSLSVYGRRAARERGIDASALQADADPATSVGDLVDRTASRAGVQRSRAVEVALVVASTLGDGEHPRRFLSPDCPPDIADLFFRHPEAQALPRAPAHAPEPHVMDERRTLSSGRPGAAHPLAVSQPTAQRGSVVEPDPHGASKLSSGTTTLERGARTLATGAPQGEPPP